MSRTRRSVAAAAAVIPLSLAAFVPSVSRAEWVLDGIPICTETHAQSSLAIVTDGNNGAVIAWVDQRFSNADIFAQRISSSGTPLWSGDGLAVCTAASGQFSPTAIGDAGGGIVVFWMDQRNTSTSATDIYGQRLDGQGFPQWELNGVPVVNSPKDETFPIAIFDTASPIAVGDPQPGYVIGFLAVDFQFDDVMLRVQHIDRLGGALWTATTSGGLLLSASIGQRRGMALSSDGTGILRGPKGAVMAWQEITADGGDILARRVSGGGAVQWGAPVVVCSAAGMQSEPRIAHVGSGHTIVVWEDRRTPDTNLYAQKLDNAGTREWVVNGLPVCQASQSQQFPSIVSDGAGGAVIVWRDSRQSPVRLFAQRIDANGAPLWVLDGVRVCTSDVGAQFNQTVAGDGSGGVLIAWTDNRSGANDIYSQHVDGNGNRVWADTGVPLTQGANSQDSPVMLGTPTYEIVAWVDQRAGNSDIYATHLGASGIPVAAPPAVAAQRATLSFLSANPARGFVDFALELPDASPVSVEVIDARGRRVRSVAHLGSVGAGRHVLRWDGRDDLGTTVASGVYYVRARMGGATVVARTVQLR